MVGTKKKDFEATVRHVNEEAERISRRGSGQFHPERDIPDPPPATPPPKQKIDPFLKDIESEAASAADAVNKLIALRKKAEHSIAIKAGKGVDARIMMHIINHLFTAHAAIKNEKPDWIISDPADAIIHIANAIMNSEKVKEKLGNTDPIAHWIHVFTSIGVFAMESLYHLETELLKQEKQTGDDKPETIKKEMNDDDTNIDN